jgi:hypothetical protein
MRKCNKEKFEIFSDITYLGALFKNQSRGIEQNTENAVHPEWRL